MKLQFISSKDLDYYIEQKHATLVDVRSREEYQHWHLIHARNLPLEESQRWLNYYPPTTSLIIFYCQFGSASLQACRLAMEKGWNVASLAGGYEHYHGAYRP